MLAKYIFGNKRERSSVKNKAKQMIFGKTLVLAVTVASISYLVVSSVQKSKASQQAGVSDLQGIF